MKAVLAKFVEDNFATNFMKVKVLILLSIIGIAPLYSDSMFEKKRRIGGNNVSKDIRAAIKQSLDKHDYAGAASLYLKSGDKNKAISTLERGSRFWKKRDSNRALRLKLAADRIK